jgi:sulfur transfer protein SufE
MGDIAGLAYNITNDLELLDRGMMIYDGLYSWAKYLQAEKHTQNPTEKHVAGCVSKIPKA